MAEAPRTTYPDPSPGIAILADDRRHCDDVVRVGSVLEAQKKAKCNGGYRARFHVHSPIVISDPASLATRPTLFRLRVLVLFPALLAQAEDRKVVYIGLESVVV